MEAYHTTENMKEEVADCGFVEVDSQDVHQLCTACLCATRTTYTLSDGALKQYYMHILTEMQPEGGVVLQSPRVCWECVSHLKRSVRFREQVQDSYRLLQPMLSVCDKEDLDEFLQTSVRRPGRLKTCFAHSINISPQDDDTQLMTFTRQDDDGAAYVCDAEDVVTSPPMCKDNYQSDNSNKEQLDENDAHLIKEELNDIKTSNIPNSTQAFTSDVNSTFVCDYCHKGLTSIAALERHIATYNIYPHNNKTVPSPCEDCAVVLCSDDQCSECPNKLNLLQHNNKQGTSSGKHFLSKECDKSFSVDENLPRDKRVHSGENPYQCAMCHKFFTRKSELIKHKRIHYREKPFQCEVCYKSFTQKGDLIKHKRKHTGEKTYQCKMCRKSFRSKPSLIYHIRTHTSNARLYKFAINFYYSLIANHAE